MSEHIYISRKELGEASFRTIDEIACAEADALEWKTDHAGNIRLTDPRTGRGVTAFYIAETNNYEWAIMKESESARQRGETELATAANDTLARRIAEMLYLCFDKRERVLWETTNEK